jgi:RNA polymerase sigma factor (sigma-70 family)
MTHIEPPSLQPTRHSLLSRLKNWNNQDAWQEFFDTYWRLIYSVARKAGLDDAEAQDAVQDTILSVAKEMADFKYDKSKGSFKGWLKVVTKRRVMDLLRKRYRQLAAGQVNIDATGIMDSLPDQAGPCCPELDDVWEEEWQRRLLEVAFERVKRTSPPRQFQMFELLHLQRLPVADIAKTLGVSRIAIHVAAHRIRKLLKIEVRRLEDRI